MSQANSEAETGPSGAEEDDRDDRVSEWDGNT